MSDDLKAFFLTPKTPKQRQYEALRAYVLEGVPAKEAAERFGFTEATLYVLAHHLRAGHLELFPPKSTGPKGRRLSPAVREQIAQLRKQPLSVAEIVARLDAEHIGVSARTVERMLKEAGFGKLPRRSAAQQGLSKNHMLLPERDRSEPGLRGARAVSPRVSGGRVVRVRALYYRVRPPRRSRTSAPTGLRSDWQNPGVTELSGPEIDRRGASVPYSTL